MLAVDWRGHGAPNQNADEHQEEDANQTAAAKDRERFRPIDSKCPEAYPRQQWQPGHDYSYQTDYNIEQGSQNINQTE